jgi:hypothetical protein
MDDLHPELVELDSYIAFSYVPFQRQNGLGEVLLEYFCVYRRLEMVILCHYREMYSPLKVEFDFVEYSDLLMAAYFVLVLKGEDDYHTLEY